RRLGGRGGGREAAPAGDGHRGPVGRDAVVLVGGEWAVQEVGQVRPGQRGDQVGAGQRAARGQPAARVAGGGLRVPLAPGPVPDFRAAAGARGGGGALRVPLAPGPVPDVRAAVGVIAEGPGQVRPVGGGDGLFV